MYLDIRKKENLHIVFWLIKDFAWIMTYKEVGLSMAIPTILLSIWLTIKSKNLRADFYHNLAVTCWIIGNSIWMFGEFYCDDCTRNYARPAFIVGLAIITFYYVSDLWRRKVKPTT